MTVKYIGRCFLLLLLFVFLRGGLAGESLYLHLDLDVIPAPDLDISKHSLKKDILAGMEEYYNRRNIIISPSKTGCDYMLEGTVTVKHFRKSTHSFSILFKAKHMKFNARQYIGLVPPLAFKPFSNRDKIGGGGISPAEDIDDAVDESLKDLLAVMDEKGVFDFHKHPLFANLAPAARKKVEQAVNRRDLEDMAGRIIRELAAVIRTGKNTRPTRVPYVKDYTPRLEKIMAEIQALKKQKQPVVDLKKALGKKWDAINQIRCVNIASIIIRTHSTGTGSPLPLSFAAVISPDPPCPRCFEPVIKAGNLGALNKPGDFQRLAREHRYLLPYRMKGQLVIKNGRKEIILKQADYLKIFDINQNGRLKPGELLKSIKSSSGMHPHILVDSTG